MKRTHIILGVLAASIFTAGATAFTTVKLTPGKHTIRTVEYETVGSHFTSWDRDDYPDLTYAAENAVKAVVNIETIQEVKISRAQQYNPFFEFFGIPQEYEDQTQERRAGGSGVIISPDGYIVTNNHVIENATKLKVKLYDNRIFEARLIGTDPTTDVALIKIDEDGLASLPFGNSEQLRLGEWVLAIGSPFDLPSTVTAGIVSAKGRQLSVIPNDFSIESFIQTDAAVNRGNSGGALVNVRGELVGINTLIKSPTGSFAGYSFAVPASIVSKVVVDLKEFGVVQRAMLGIQFSELTPAFIERFGEEYKIKETEGLYVAEVDPEGGAAAAGIKKGDVITEIDGNPVITSSALMEQIAKHRPNDRVTITAKRDGKVKQFDVVLRNKAGKAELLKSDYVDPFDALGGTFADLSDKAKKDLKIKGGVQVQSIKDGGILSKARVRKGYVITHINDRPINTVSDISKISSKITTLDGVYPDGKAASYTLME